MSVSVEHPTHFKVVVLLCSGGVDSCVAAWYFLNNDHWVSYDRVVMVFTETPLTRKEYAERVLDVVIERLGVDLVVLRGTWKMYRPPLCRLNWKFNPLVKWLKEQPRPILLVTGKKRVDNPVRARYQQWDVFAPNRVKDVYEYKPLWNLTKDEVWRIAERVFPELVTLWKEVATINGGHTSVDCVPCLRRALKQQ